LTMVLVIMVDRSRPEKYAADHATHCYGA